MRSTQTHWPALPPCSTARPLGPSVSWTTELQHDETLARYRYPPSGRTEGHLPAIGVRRGHLRRPARHGTARVPGRAGVLRPYLHHRGHGAFAGQGGAAPVRPGRGPGDPTQDGLRRGQDPYAAGGLSPGTLRAPGERVGRGPAHPGCGRGCEAAQGTGGGHRRHQPSSAPAVCCNCWPKWSIGCGRTATRTP